LIKQCQNRRELHCARFADCGDDLAAEIVRCDWSNRTGCFGWIGIGQHVIQCWPASIFTKYWPVSQYFVEVDL